MPLQPAVLGANLRLKNFRLAYLPATVAMIRLTRVRIFLDGVLATARVRHGSVTIRDVLNDEPNTCTLTLEGEPAPTVGLPVRLTINSNVPRLLFSGTLQAATTTFQGTPAHEVYPCQAVDDHARINWKRPFGIWQAVSASQVATDLVQQFAPAFTTLHVEPGLPAVTIACDGTEQLTGALRRLAKMIGGYFYVEDSDLHLFLEEATDLPDPIDGTPKRFLHDPPIAATADDSQLRTRVYGRGHGEALLVDCAAGETILPVQDARMFNESGGRAIAATTPDGAATERLAYTSSSSGSGGTMVGPGAAPSVAPDAYIEGGSPGLPNGTYTYAYTWVTASGESLPSPLDAVTVTGFLDPPTVAIQAAQTVGSGIEAGTYDYVYTWITTSGETTQSPISNAVALPSGGRISALIPTGPPSVTQRSIYRRKDGTGTFKLFGTMTENVNTSFIDGTATASLGPAVPSSNTAVAQRVHIANVALGPAAVTSRKVYRTVVNGAQLKVQQTIANNTATDGGTDTVADGALGANAPTSDSSGLTAATGQVNAGSTSMPTAGVGALQPAGWVRTEAEEVIRYTGISGNTLVGIPSFGVGSIRKTIPYGMTLSNVPSLRGVTGIVATLFAGSPVYIWVQRDDLAAQSAAAARETTDAYAADGIHEHTLVDERRAEPSITALCDADLALFAYPIVTVTYASRDVKTRSGKPITITLASPAIDETLTIQDVAIDQLDVADGLAPRFTVSASSTRFSLEDILRRLSGLVEVD